MTIQEQVKRMREQNEKWKKESEVEDIYCCKCERETPHRKVTDDEWFAFGLECSVCEIVWEAEPFDID